MKNCKVDFKNKEIRITKNFYKASQTIGTNEFETMIELQQKLPSFKIVFLNEFRRGNQIWNPTYQQMFDFISFTTKGNDEAIAELHETIEVARITGKGYNMVRRWFMDRYRESLEYEKNDWPEVAVGA